jgi:hypothetical protein
MTVCGQNMSFNLHERINCVMIRAINMLRFIKDCIVYIYISNSRLMPITMAARSKAWTAFARWNTGIVGSDLTRGMDVCVRLFCLCVAVCVGRGLATGWFPVQGVLPSLYRLRNWKTCCRAVQPQIDSLLIQQDTQIKCCYTIPALCMCISLPHATIHFFWLSEVSDRGLHIPKLFLIHILLFYGAANS